MLPAPLNLITVAFLPMHQIYLWRARLFVDRGVDQCMSVAGSLADWVLKLVLFVPICVIEFAAFFLDGSVRLEERWSAVILLPLEIVGLVTSVLYKMVVVDKWTMRVMVKSRLAKGGSASLTATRDATECIGAEDDNSVTLHQGVGG